jgi:hypothetical protein
VNVFVLLNFVGIHAERYYRDVTLFAVFFVCFGALLCIAGHWRERWEDWGISLLGGFGLFLTFPGIWRWSRVLTRAYDIDIVQISVVSGVLLCGAMLYFVRKGSALATTFFFILLLRYYFDRFYDFMPKALFFTVGGILLMAMGFYLERTRRKRKQAKQLANAEEAQL